MFEATISRHPQLKYITTPPDNDDFLHWYMEMSVTARLVVYITFLGTIMLLIFLILKFLSECDLEAETDRLLPVVGGEEERPMISGNQDEETGSFSSSEDLDSSRLCVICFRKRRNCFFVPCGHSVTCRRCAQKILSEENKVCPICRRVIRKSKRFLLRINPVSQTELTQ